MLRALGSLVAFVVLCPLLIVALVALASVREATAAELVMIESHTCEWCEVWNRQIADIYPKTEEGRIAPLRRVDISEPMPLDLADIAKGNFTPTFVLVANGVEIGRIRGYPGEDFFWGMLGELITKLPDQNTASANLPN